MLNLDIERFDETAEIVDKYKEAIKPHAPETCKIIYFFYELEYKLIPKLLDKVVRELKEQKQKKKQERQNGKIAEETEKDEENRKYFDVIKFLNKPSMENIDYSFLGWETYNGNITRLIKNSLEKELPLETILRIQANLDNVADTWHNRILFARIAVEMDKSVDIDGAIRVLKSILKEPHRIMYDNPYQLSPTVGRFLEISMSDDFHSMKQFDEIKDEVLRLKGIPDGVNDDEPSEFIEYMNQNSEVQRRLHQITPIETLYLRVSQFERIGEIKDILLIKREEINANYDVSPKLIRKMRRLKNIPICIEKVEDFIKNNKNANRIDECVYLRSDVSPEERRTMKDNAWKIPVLLDFCIRARPNTKDRNEVSLLQIISCLQAILKDEKNDFKYFFPLYQVYMKHKPTDHFKNEQQNTTDDLENGKHQHIVDAIKLYWVRRIDDHWNANLGEYEVRRKLMEYENKLYEVLKRIYSCSDIFEVKSASQYYHNRFRELSGSIY